MPTMESYEMPRRLKTADVLKGILILGIVFVHIFMLNQSGKPERTISPVLQCLYLGLIGFFVVSGYFLPSASSYIDRIKKRSKLLIVLTICSLILPVALFLWLWALGQPSTLDDLSASIIRSFGNLDVFMPFDAPRPVNVCYSAYTHYFLWVMLLSFLIFYAIADRVLANVKLFAVTIVCLLLIEAAITFINLNLPFYSNLVPISVAFMLFGALLSHHEFLERLETASIKSSKTWVPLIISLAVLAVLVYLFPPGITFDFNYFGEYGGLSAVPFLIEGLLVFVVYSYASMIVARIPIISNIISVCGKYCLALAVIHVFIVRVILAVFYTLPTDAIYPPLSLVQMLLLTVFDIGFIIAVCMLIDRWKASHIISVSSA